MHAATTLCGPIDAQTTTSQGTRAFSSPLTLCRYPTIATLVSTVSEQISRGARMLTQNKATDIHDEERSSESATRRI